MGMPQRNNLPIQRKRRISRIRVKKNKIERKKQKERELKLRRMSFLNRMLVVTLLMIFITGTGFVFYGQYEIAQLNDVLMEKQQEIVDLSANRDYIRVQLEPYQASNYIENIARVSLGMDYPTKDQYIHLQKYDNSQSKDSLATNKEK